MGLGRIMRDVWLDAANAIRTHLVDASGTAVGTSGSAIYVQGATGASAGQVQGTAADGSPTVGNPVQVGGKDASGNAQALTTDSDGHTQVDVLSLPSGASATHVQGTAADGAAAVGNPVQCGGKDGSGNAQALLTGTDGSLSPMRLDSTNDSVDAGKKGGANWAAGTQANAWDAASVAAAGTSASLDCQYLQHVSVFGNSSAATTLTLQVSQNNSTWYDTTETVTVGASGGNFWLNVTIGARYVRLKSSDAATITATLAAKG